MNHAQFHIGLCFWCDDKQWRCTDVGSRIVAAISLEPREIIELSVDPADSSKRTELKYVDAADWLGGPPYAVVEHVFDEYSIQICSLTRESD